MSKLTIVKYLEDTYDEDEEFLVKKPVVCNDGFTISVQGGSEFLYCSPRKKCNDYYEVECGFPSEDEELLKEYAEDPENLTQTVYSYIPIDLVEKVILKHGGIKNE
jgi:hypothetical protein